MSRARGGSHLSAEGLDGLGVFPREFYGCLTARADVLSKLIDAVLCPDGSVHSIFGLSVTPERGCGHVALYDAANHGWVDIVRLHRALLACRFPAARMGGSSWESTSAPGFAPTRPPTRTGCCHAYGRGRGTVQLISGWPVSFVTVLESGHISWTALLRAIRLGPDDDATEVTAGQLCEVVVRLDTAARWTPDRHAILIVCDAGYGITRLAFLLADLPMVLCRRLRSDRLFRFPSPATTRQADGSATTARPGVLPRRPGPPACTDQYHTDRALGMSPQPPGIVSTYR